MLKQITLSLAVLIALFAGALLAHVQGAGGLTGCYQSVRSDPFGATQTAWSCFSAPNPNAGGAWSAVVDLRPSPPDGQTWRGGYSLGVEGAFDYQKNQPTVDRFYLWDYGVDGNGRTILFRDLTNPDLLVLGEENKPMNQYTTGNQFVAHGVMDNWHQTGNYYSANWGWGISGSACHRFESGLCVQ